MVTPPGARRSQSSVWAVQTSLRRLQMSFEESEGRGWNQRKAGETKGAEPERPPPARHTSPAPGRLPAVPWESLPPPSTWTQPRALMGVSQGCQWPRMPRQGIRGGNPGEVAREDRLLKLEAALGTMTSLQGPLSPACITQLLPRVVYRKAQSPQRAGEGR